VERLDVERLDVERLDVERLDARPCNRSKLFPDDSVPGETLGLNGAPC